jgi:hypothetical protein
MAVAVSARRRFWSEAPLLIPAPWDEGGGGREHTFAFCALRLLLGGFRLGGGRPGSLGLFLGFLAHVLRFVHFGAQTGDHGLHGILEMLQLALEIARDFGRKVPPGHLDGIRHQQVQRRHDRPSNEQENQAHGQQGDDRHDDRRPFHQSVDLVVEAFLVRLDGRLDFVHIDAHADDPTPRLKELYKRQLGRRLVCSRLLLPVLYEPLTVFFADLSHFPVEIISL